MNRRLICACILIAAFSNGSLRAEVLVGYIDFSLLSKDSKFAQDSKPYLLEKERVAKFNLAQEKDPEKRKKIIADYNSDFQAEFNRSMTAISRTVSAVAKSKGIETVLISDVAFAYQRVNFTPHALSLLDGGSPVEIADLKNLKVGTISTRSLAHSLGAVDAQRFMMEFKGEVKGEWVDKNQYVEPAVVAQLQRVIDDLTHTTRMLEAQREERDFKDINKAINSLKWTVILVLIPVVYTLALILKKL